MKNITPLFLVIGWVLWIVGLEYISEYVFSRPTNGTVQFISIIGVITISILLIKKTYLYINKNLNK